MYMLRMEKISRPSIDEVKPSFNNLPETDHKDGKYRLRRYSVIEFLAEPTKFKVLPISSFTQSANYNNFQGDVERKFENIEEDVLKSVGMEEIVYLFRYINRLAPGVRVDIHQMRVITLQDDTPVSPAGAPQDGYDCIGMVGIDRHKIEGGEVLVSYGKDDKPFMELPLDDGVAAFLDDKTLWHNASALKATNKNEEGYMDAFILTANK